MNGNSSMTSIKSNARLRNGPGGYFKRKVYASKSSGIVNVLTEKELKRQKAKMEAANKRKNNEIMRQVFILVGISLLVGLAVLQLIG